MAKWDRDILINNIYYLIGKNNLTIKDLELQAGVNIGYLARMKKGNEKISSEFLVKACDILNISIDVIISTNLTNITDKKLFAEDYINKLIINIDNHSWEKLLDAYELIREEQTDTIYGSLPADTLPPLFFKDKESNNGETVKIFNSLYTHPDNIYGTNPIYKLPINETSYLAIVQYRTFIGLESDLYLINNNHLKGIYHSPNESSDVLNYLYQEIEKRNNPTELNNDDISLLNSIL